MQVVQLKLLIYDINPHIKSSVFVSYNYNLLSNQLLFKLKHIIQTKPYYLTKTKLFRLNHYLYYYIICIKTRWEKYQNQLSDWSKFLATPNIREESDEYNEYKNNIKMKILKKSFKRWGQGYAKMIPTTDEDLWYLYNLIEKGDQIRMKTRRKIVDDNNMMGVKKVKVKILTLTLLVVQIGYFCQGNLAITIKGKNALQNQFLKLGQYHTFCIDLDNLITIYKQQWSQYQINLVYDLSKDSFGVQICALVMQQGIAHVCYVKTSITILKQKITKNISKKNSGQQIHQKSINRFFEECYAALQNVQFQTIKCCVIASPGFINAQFLKFIMAEADKKNDKTMKKNIDKILLVKCSSGYMNSLTEVLEDPTVMSKMENTKAVAQSRTLKKFYETMKENENKIAYGEKDVIRCVELKSVDTLLIADTLFRTKDLKKRRNYDTLAETVKKLGGKVVVFSTLHSSGEQLNRITGIAAILRFEVTPLEEEEEPVEEITEKEEADIKELKIRKFDSSEDEDEAN